MNPRQNNKQCVRVLYSFPHKLGADRICYSAWQQVNGLAAAGADISVFPGSICRPVPAGVKVRPTLAWGKVRVPYKLLGTMRACRLHDSIVSNRLRKMVGQVDVIHTWPLGALRTLKTAAALGIPAVLERPNAHTRYAYEVVQKECERLGVPLPRKHEHAYNEKLLKWEEAEYEQAYRLMCPSDFVVQTFLERGFPREKLVRNMRGFDARRFHPDTKPRNPTGGIVMLFVGVCAVRKGLHFALESWLSSSAHRTGKFIIAGEFLPAYQQRLAPMLAHPSVEVLGHRNDVPDLMRQSDILVLPSLEEGSAKATSEGRASGCVLLVSEASGADCKHMENALVHRVGDVQALKDHFDLLDTDRELLGRLRRNSLDTLSQLTWEAGGVSLLSAYRDTIRDKIRADQVTGAFVLSY